MGERSTNAKIKVFIATLIVALVIGVAAFAAAQSNARATAESIQADTVNAAVERAQALNSGGYNAIIDILGRQSNANGERQWLLASNATIIYVRDVPTTNDFGGLPVASYSGGGDIERLLESAAEGKVVHGTVSMDGVEYLGSATRFMFDGIPYSLCLLTATSALGGSALTAPMMVLYALLAIALVLLVVVPTLVASRLEKRADKARASEPALAAGDSATAPAPPAEPESSAEPETELEAGSVSGSEPESAVSSDLDLGDSVLDSEPIASSDPDRDLEPGPAVPLDRDPDLDPEIIAFSEFELELFADSDSDAVSDSEPIAPFEPEPASIMLPLRPRSELEGHLREFLDSGIPDGNLVKITCRDEDAMNRVLLRLGPLAAGSDSHCYEFGDNSFIMELFEIDEPYAREALAQFLLDDAEITAFVSIDND